MMDLIILRLRSLFLGVLNSGGEILRHQWKKKPENKGKIYTQGFFKYSRHINYFETFFGSPFLCANDEKFMVGNNSYFIICFFSPLQCP
ncbi:MAG: DUF1295 domain-containing protein [Saprospirales bacterium]|nr:DUF1295 domain-containing protein [Saprospirales bacterium]